MNQIKIILILLLCSYVTLFATTDQTKINFTLEEKLWIQNKKEVIVGIRNLPPFMYLENNETKGYHTELISMILRTAGLKPKFTSVLTFKTELEEIKAGKIDISLALLKTPDRENFLLFNNFPYPVVSAIFTESSTEDIVDFKSLNGKTIATYKGYAYNDLIQHYFPKSRIVYGKDVQEMFQLVSNKKADACIQEIYSGDYIIKKLHLSNLKFGGYLELPDGKKNYVSHWGVSKKIPLLQSILDKGYQTIDESKKKALWDKWFGNSAVIPIVLTSKEKDFLKNTIFTRAYPQEWKPFYFYNQDGKNIGLVEDYWNLIKKKIGLQEKVEGEFTFLEILDRLKEGKIDIYPNITQTEEKEKYAYFSNTYEKFPLAIATKSGDRFVYSMDSLLGRTVAIAKNTSAYYLMKTRYPDINYMVVEDLKEAIKKVKNNEVYATIDVLPVLKYYVYLYGENQITISDVGDLFYNMQVMIHKDYPQLVPIINKAIASITPQEKEEILKKWFHTTIVEKEDYKYLIFYTLLLIVVIFLILFWNWLLRKKIDQAIKKYQEQEILLVQNSKKAEVGSVLGAITHQIKQPLNIINMIISDMQFKLLVTNKENINFDENFNKILNQTDFMNNTIDDFKNFFSDQDKVKIFNPKESITKVIDMFSGVFIKAQIEFNIVEKEPFQIHR